MDEQQKLEAYFSECDSLEEAKRTEQQAKFMANHIRCVCNNVIHLNNAYCPHCKRFNMATNQKQCPTCGQSLKLVVEAKE